MEADILFKTILICWLTMLTIANFVMLTKDRKKQDTPKKTYNNLTVIPDDNEGW